jgi:hypothetical protein
LNSVVASAWTFRAKTRAVISVFVTTFMVAVKTVW